MAGMTGDRFSGQVALITGGSSGIGLALGKALARRGAHVWLLARREEALQEALQTIHSASTNGDQRHGKLVADVTDWEQTGAAIDHLVEQVAPPDVVINSAGAAHPGYSEDLPLDIYRWMMEVNYFGTVHVTKAVLPAMLERGSGHLVNIASVAGFLGVFGYSAYAASKYAVRGYSDVLRSELKPRGIGVSVVFPPDTDTPQLAYENRFKPPETKALAGNTRTLSADAVAAAILRGIERRKYLIFTGHESRLIYWLASLLGSLQYPVMDWLVSRARTRLNHTSETGEDTDGADPS